MTFYKLITGGTGSYRFWKSDRNHRILHARQFVCVRVYLHHGLELTPFSEGRFEGFQGFLPVGIVEGNYRWGIVVEIRISLDILFLEVIFDYQKLVCIA